MARVKLREKIIRRENPIARVWHHCKIPSMLRVGDHLLASYAMDHIE